MRPLERAFMITLWGEKRTGTFRDTSSPLLLFHSKGSWDPGSWGLPKMCSESSGNPRMLGSACLSGRPFSGLLTWSMGRGVRTKLGGNWTKLASTDSFILDENLAPSSWSEMGPFGPSSSTTHVDGVSLNGLCHQLYLPNTCSLKHQSRVDLHARGSLEQSPGRARAKPAVSQPLTEACSCLEWKHC